MTTLHRLCADSSVSRDAIVSFLERIAQEFGQDKLQQILNQRNEQRYTPVHVSLFARSFTGLDVLLEYGADPDIKCHGTPPIHLAIRSCQQPGGQEFGTFAVHRLLKTNVNPFAKDDNNYTILHLLAMHSSADADIWQHVVANVNVASMVNAVGRYDGYSPLHICAMHNSLVVGYELLKAGASPSLKSKVTGSLPIHIAAHFKSKGVFGALCSASHASLLEKDSLGCTAEAILACDGWALKRETSEIFSRTSALHTSALQTGIFSSKWCVQHFTCPPSQLRTAQVPPENLWRLNVLIDPHNGALFSEPLSARLQYDLHARSAALCDVLRVHEWSYIRHLQATCDGLSEDAEQPDGMANLDGDTAISKHSFAAALGAAGAVCAAVDKVVSGQLGNAFCPVRPPGHHAGPRGAGKSSGSDSHGFCLFNNVSVAAAYAMTQHRDVIRRVAIVDFDVHHGNGTEATVRNLRPTVEVTTHDDFGMLTKVCVPSYKPWRDFDDPENVLFVSVHGYGPPQRGLEHMFPRAAFYPGTGKTTLPQVVSPVSPQSATSSPLPAAATLAELIPAATTDGGVEHAFDDDDVDDDDDDNNVDSKNDADGDEDDSDEEDEDFEDPELQEAAEEAQGMLRMPEAGGRELEFMLTYDHSNPASRAVSRAPSPLILDIGVSLPEPLEHGGIVEETAHSRLLADFQYRHQWRNYFREHIFPRLVRFKPDLVLISAGFDAHRKDTINAGYIALGEEDFAWVTEHLLEIAQSYAHGRVVSVLEGGYQIGGEFTSAFARSVTTHVERLVRATHSKRTFSQQNSALETAAEIQYMEDLQRAHEQELEHRRAERMRELARFEAERQAAENSEARVEESSAVFVTHEGDSSRKRRRPQVDYAALDEKLKSESGGHS